MSWRTASLTLLVVVVASNTLGKWAVTLWNAGQRAAPPVAGLGLLACPYLLYGSGTLAPARLNTRTYRHNRIGALVRRQWDGVVV